MVKQAVLEETATELTEQIVLSFIPDAEVFAPTKEGDFELKRKYEEVHDRILAILKSNINGGK